MNNEKKYRQKPKFKYDDLDILPNKLIRLREEKNYSQKDVATLCKIDPSTISSYETGARKPKYEDLVKFAKLFNVSGDYLLGLKPRENNIDKK